MISTPLIAPVVVPTGTVKLVSPVAVNVKLNPVSTVTTVAVPEQVAEPFPAVALVDAEVLPDPAAVMTKAVPPAIVFVPVKATVAVPPVLPLLNTVSAHVWPIVPVAVIPLV